MAELRLHTTEFNDRLRRIAARIEGRAAREALKSVAKLILKEAKEIVPVDTGALRESLEILETKKGGEGTTVTLGSEKDYAIYVHEDMTANHPRGGVAKFLTKPMEKVGKPLREALRREIRRII